jgi:Domain of unknown function (DUF4272)
MDRPTTEAWARSLNISTAPTPPAVEDYDEPCHFSAREIATRVLIIHGVVAVASGVDPEPIAHWYREQGVWDQVSPQEQGFLTDPESRGPDARNSLGWQQEAEWALLWVVGKVEWLGLPNRRCDTRRIVDEIIPPLGSEIEPFLASAKLQSPGLLLAEDDRHYDLWCRYFQTHREEPHRLPCDLDTSVLYQRRYAFEWLDGIEAWDDVRCDS